MHQPRQGSRVAREREHLNTAFGTSSLATLVRPHLLAEWLHEPRPRKSFRRNRFDPVLIAASLIGAGIIFVATSRYGAGLSPDSVEYITVARNLVAGAGLRPFSGTQFVLWPPLYPFALALFSQIFQIDPLVSAQLVNAFAFALTVYLSGQIMLRLFPAFRALAYLGTAVVLLSVPLFQVMVMAWSEPLFICFLVLFFLASGIFLRTGNQTFFALMVISAALAALTRYIGVSLILTGAAAILLLFRATLRNRLKYSLGFAVGAALPIGLWGIRNFLLTRTALGPRGPSTATLPQTISQIFTTVTSWFLLQGIALQIVALIGLVLIVGLGLGTSSRQGGIKLLTPLPYVGSTALFVFFYLALLIMSASTTNLPPINTRFLSPLYMPLIVFVLFSAEILRETFLKRFSERLTKVALILVLALWLFFYPGRAMVSQVTTRVSQGAGGYSTAAWQESETIQYVKEHLSASKSRIYTNDAWALYILTGAPARFSPRTTGSSTAETSAYLSRIAKSWTLKEPAVLVWFTDNQMSFLYSLDELQSAFSFSKIADLKDGSIYAFVPK